MLFTEEWLRQYCNPDMDTDNLAETLTMAGLEVEEVTDVAPAFSGVVVAEVLTCRDHENSDHLHVCEVNAGTGEVLQIVCGAPNVKAGIKVACATIGAVLPGDFKIKKSKLRGEVSFGMLCSARELGIGEANDGIWILPDDAPVGTSIRDYANLDGKKIEIKLTPNRGDALSLVGVARDLHAVTGAPLNVPAMPAVAPTCECRKTVKVEDGALCGRFTGRMISGLNPSAQTPAWMLERLERAGMRHVNTLVDISNYVMLELGRPSHLFDAKKLTGDCLTVRWAREGESITLLNDEKRDLDPYFGVICDGDKPACIAGIMGGSDCAVDDDTTSVFLEMAFWQQGAIQGRCRRLNFSTDAAYRFERGVDFSTTVEHMEYMTALILKICGTDATKVGPVDDQIIDLPERKTVTMRVARCNKVIGVDIPREAMQETFTRLGFEHTFDGEAFHVKAPAYRFDIEIEEDLIEEVARLYGYEKLPDRPPMARIEMKSRPEEMRSAHALRLSMAGLGYQELINFSFVPEAWEVDFADNHAPIRLQNPIASQLSVMRTQLIGGLVDILKYNLNRKAERVRVFELGRVFFPDPTVNDGPWSVKGVRQPQHIAGLAYGDAVDPQWGQEKRHVDFFDVKGDVERLCAPLKPRFVKEAFPGLHPGRSAAIYIGEIRVGFMGELHPRLTHSYNLPLSPVVFELDVESLLKIGVPSYTPVSKFQPVSRDIAVVVPADFEVQKLFDAVLSEKTADPRMAPITGFNLFDVYRPAGDDQQPEKSLAFAVEMTSSGDEALSEEQIDHAMAGIVDALAHVGARLRS